MDDRPEESRPELENGELENSRLESGSRTALWVALFLVLAGLAVYGRVGAHEFVAYDDNEYVYENPQVLGGLTLDGLRWAFTSAHSSNWHPVTWLSHMADVELFGLWAGGHHWVNAGLHALNAVLLFVFLRRCTGALWRSALAAALFCVHPLRVQSVAWVSERKDLLASVFFFLCLIAWLRYVRRPGAGSFALALLAFALGLLSKPMLVSVPVVLLFLDRWPLERLSRERWPRLLIEKLPFVGLAVLSSVATVLAQHAGRALGSTETIGLAERVANALTAYGTYLVQALWPHGLAYFHPHAALVSPDASPFGVASLSWGGVLLVVTFLLVRSARRLPYLGVGWLWFGTMLLPVIGIVQVGDQAWAERYAYLPLVGLHVALAFGVGALVRWRPGSKPALIVACGVALGAYAWRARVAVDAWRDSRTLFETALASTERNYRAHEGLGNLYLAEEAYDQARAQYEAALAIRADDPGTLFNLGVLEERQGRSAAAEELFERAIASDPRWSIPYLNLAKVRMDLGQLDAAREALLALLEIEPGEFNAHYNLGLVRMAQGDEAGAIDAFEEAVRHGPDFLDAHRALGTLLRRAGRRAEAREHLEWACGGASPHPQGATQLAWILAAAPEPELRDVTRAIHWARYAIEATGGTDPDAIEALAAALAAGARFEEAIAEQERALRISPPERREARFARLRQYRDGKAFVSE